MITHVLFFSRGDELVMVEIPPGVSFDGAWPNGDLFAFTDRDLSSPAYGASFDLAGATLSSASLAAALAAKREQFRKGGAPSPACEAHALPLTT